MDEFLRGKRLALRFLAARMYTSREIYDRLRRKNYGDDVAESIVEELISEGALNDKLYAECYITDSVNLGAKGVYRIRQELMRKGVSSSIIDRAFDEADVDIESALKEFVSQKLSVSEITDRSDYEKFKLMLVRRGYSLDEINRVLNEYDFELAD